MVKDGAIFFVDSLRIIRFMMMFRMIIRRSRRMIMIIMPMIMMILIVMSIKIRMIMISEVI